MTDSGSETSISTDVGAQADGILRLDAAELDRMRGIRLATTTRLCWDHHPHYGEAMRRLGLDRSSIDSVESLQQLPLTSKQDFLDDPESFRLAPDPDLPVDERILHSVMYTTGTKSGVPAPVYNTGSDYYGILVETRRAARILGISGHDRIANVFPLTAFPTGGYFRAQATAASVGAASVVTHTGRGHEDYFVHRSLDEAVTLVSVHDVTVIWGVASFVARLLTRARVRSVTIPSLRMCLVTGERISDATDEEIVDGMRAVGAAETRVWNRYGFTEGSTLIPCGEQTWHNVVPEQILLETVTPDTGVPTDDGEPGLLAITHLHRRGTVLLRYVIGDEVTLARGPCPDCGITSERVTSMPRRRGRLQKIKGTMVDLESVVEALDGIPGLHDFQIRLRRSVEGHLDGTIEGLLIRIVAAGNVRRDVAERVRSVVRGVANVTPDIEDVDSRSIFDPSRDVKKKRIV